MIMEATYVGLLNWLTVVYCQIYIVVDCQTGYWYLFDLTILFAELLGD